MRVLLCAMALLFSTNSQAMDSKEHHFDRFLGFFNATGEPSIRGRNTQICDRYNFKGIDKVIMYLDGDGHSRVHTAKLSAGAGWSKHPLLDFRSMSQHQLGFGAQASNSSNSTSAKNDYVVYAGETYEKVVFYMEQPDPEKNSYVLRLFDELYVQNVLQSGCYYEVQLVKVPRPER